MASKKVQTRRSIGPTRHVALLRGVNVGGKNRLSMKDLIAVFADLGCTKVQTYIQSGNVVFEAAPNVGAKLASKASEQLAKRLDLAVPVVVRTIEELEDVIERNPFLRRGAAEEFLHVGFMAELPSPKLVQGLDPHRSAGDSFAVVGQEIYLHLPKGVADSKLTTAYFDKALGTTSTFRNWRTVLKLIAMGRDTI